MSRMAKMNSATSSAFVTGDTSGCMAAAAGHHGKQQAPPTPWPRPPQGPSVPGGGGGGGLGCSCDGGDGRTLRPGGDCRSAGGAGLPVPVRQRRGGTSLPVGQREDRTSRVSETRSGAGFLVAVLSKKTGLTWPTPRGAGPAGRRSGFRRGGHRFTGMASGPGSANDDGWRGAPLPPPTTARGTDSGAPGAHRNLQGQGLYKSIAPQERHVSRDLSFVLEIRRSGHYGCPFLLW